MLIVEGPDGAGKTTLIQTLMNSLGWPVAPRVVSKDTEAQTDLVKWVEDNVETGCQPLIFDRHRLISEPIYGPVIRGQMEPGFDNVKWLRRQQFGLRQCEPFVIFCLPPFAQVFANVHNDDHNKVVAPYIQEIYYLYLNTAAAWPDACTSVWDYTHPETLSLLVADVKGWAHHQGFPI